MKVFGTVPYHNKKEKLRIWRELKREFGDQVKIFIQDGFIDYQCRVDRNFF